MKIFRLFLIGVLFIVFNNIAHAQLNVGYNHSNLVVSQANTVEYFLY